MATITPAVLQAMMPTGPGESSTAATAHTYPPTQTQSSRPSDGYTARGGGGRGGGVSRPAASLLHSSVRNDAHHYHRQDYKSDAGSVGGKSNSAYAPNKKDPDAYQYTTISYEHGEMKYPTNNDNSNNVKEDEKARWSAPGRGGGGRGGKRGGVGSVGHTPAKGRGPIYRAGPTQPTNLMSTDVAPVGSLAQVFAQPPEGQYSGPNYPPAVGPFAAPAPYYAPQQPFGGGFAYPDQPYY